jgi:hypothetical protein
MCPVAVPVLFQKRKSRQAALDCYDPHQTTDCHFLDASKIGLVQDNLSFSTHKPVSLEPRRLVVRFERHYPPKHGSWLDMAETELRVPSRQCLDRQIPNKQALIEEVVASQQGRLAIHHCRGTHQVEAPVPGNMSDSEH